MMWPEPHTRPFPQIYLGTTLGHLALVGPRHPPDTSHRTPQGRYVLFCCIYFICPWLTDELMCVLSGPPCMDVRDGCTLRAPFSLRFTAHVVEQFRVEREGSGRLQCANLRVGYLHYYECANLSNPKLTMNLTGVDLSDADLSGADDFWTWYGDFEWSGGDTQLLSYPRPATQLPIAFVPPFAPSVFNRSIIDLLEEAFLAEELIYFGLPLPPLPPALPRLPPLPAGVPPP